VYIDKANISLDKQLTNEENIMNILSIAKANSTIKLIQTAGAKLDQRIHEVAVSGLYHFFTCGDNTILSNLVKAMPKSTRGNALKFWISQHSNNALRWDNKAHDGTGGYKGKKPDIQTEQVNELVQAGYDAPFYFKEDKEASVWNPNASIYNLVKKINAEREKGALTIEEDALKALALSLPHLQYQAS